MRNPTIIKACFLAALTALSSVSANDSEQLKVAFVGDQGTGESARAVLQLIDNEGVDLLLIQGDLGYSRNAAAQWINNIDQILGTDIPVLLAVGNHENYEWLVYRRWQLDRIRNVPDLICEGNPGVKAHCSFRGVSIVQVAAGVNEVAGVLPDDEYAEYLERELSSSANIWRFCSWHKNQQNMQTGGKTNETGWDVYSACLKNGGIVATGHEHAYSRTFQMTDFQNQVVGHRNDILEIGPGSSFAFVSGLGGRGIREQLTTGDWWASVYSASQNANYGALFCTLENNKATCEFKDIAGNVPDRFTLENQNTPGAQVVNDNLAEIDESIYKVNIGSMSGRTCTLLLLILLALIIIEKTVSTKKTGVHEK